MDDYFWLKFLATWAVIVTLNLIFWVVIIVVLIAAYERIFQGA